ncbi:MAG: hypothetical protein ACLGI8_02490 [Acidimicrobiia bacterium]
MAARFVLVCLKRLAPGVAAVGLVLPGCTDDGPGRPDQLAEGRDGPNPGALPTVPGGVALAPTDPAVALVGTDLAYGSPLPSEQLAAEALLDTPEVVAVLARRAYAVPEARRLADVVAITVDGAEVFDEAALAAFHEGLVSGLAGGGEAEEEELVARPVLVGGGQDRAVMGWAEGDLFTVVLAGSSADARTVVTRQLEARRRGETGSTDPATPMARLSSEAAFVEVPTVAFAPIPPPEEEPDGPEPPALAGALGVQGRYGVTAGERRTVVWSFALDLAAHPTAESVAPLLGPLVSARAGGAAATATEVVDRIVVSATVAEGERSALAFRHQGLVLLVEGERPDQLEAVATAWITALGPG